jgi:hypothetical protein
MRAFRYRPSSVDDFINALQKKENGEVLPRRQRRKKLDLTSIFFAVCTFHWFFLGIAAEALTDNCHTPA